MRRLSIMAVATLGALTLPPACVPAGAQAVAGADGAVAILLQQARFWTEKQRPDVARESLRRVLLLSPANPEALAALDAPEPAAGHDASVRNPAPDTPPDAARSAAVALLARGDDAAAARALSARIAAGERDPALPLLLAEAQAGLGHQAEAEHTLRAALAQRPDDGRAMIQLAVLLDREGRAPDATELFARAQSAGAGPLVAAASARALRRQALATADPADRVALLRAASAETPGDPWLRLDLSRALRAAGHLAEARTLMAEAAPDGAGFEALRAGIVFANETGDTTSVAALRARLPPEARPPDPRVASVQSELQREIAQAAALGAPAAGDRLLQLADRPDPDGARGAALARALSGAGLADAARRAVARAGAATQDAAPEARLAYAAALLDGNDDAAAEHLLAAINDAALPPAPRADLARLRVRLAIRRADRLAEQGQLAGALTMLAPALAARPADVALNAALARLYQAAGRPREALAVVETLLRADPADATARRQAVVAALAAGETRRSGALVREGLQVTPRDPQAWLASADLAQARGDKEAALHALRRARVLRGRQLAPGGHEAAATPASTAQTGIVLAMLAPGDVGSAALSAPPPGLTDPASTANDTETDEDGDAVFVRRRMLDTNVTELPVPAGHAAPTVAVSASAPPVNTRPPLPVVIAASVASPDGETDSALPSLADPAAPVTAADPLTARIDRDIAALTEPGVQAATAFRGRSGTAGTSQLAEITVPLQANFGDGGSGRIGLAVTPTFLDAGRVSRGVGSLPLFGSLGLGGLPNGVSIPGQTATGTGLDVSYTTGDLSADIGTTPLGFAQQNVVGGVEWAPELGTILGQPARLRLTGERRAVTDSVLSYAGTRDPQSGQDWGGVTYVRGHANLEFSAGPADFYVGGGGGVLDGRNVRRNTEIEAAAGGSVPILSAESQELRLGLDLVYAAFAKNLGGFTLGQGGYFSPQSYFAALLPITFKDHPTDRLSYEIGATTGIQTYHQHSSATFPNNSSLQSALEVQQSNPATAVPGIATLYPGGNETGFSGGAHASIDYRLTPGFHIGAKVDYAHTGNYNQTVGLLYGRYLLDGLRDR